MLSSVNTGLTHIVPLDELFLVVCCRFTKPDLVNDIGGIFDYVNDNPSMHMAGKPWLAYNMCILWFNWQPQRSCSPKCNKSLCYRQQHTLDNNLAYIFTTNASYCKICDTCTKVWLSLMIIFLSLHLQMNETLLLNPWFHSYRYTVRNNTPHSIAILHLIKIRQWLWWVVQQSCHNEQNFIFLKSLMNVSISPVSSPNFI